MFMVPVNIQLLALVGMSLSTWSQVERSMTALFTIISELPALKAIALYDGIISFEVRLAILDRMMTFENVSELEAETWERMSRRLAKFYKRRHQLAHFGLGTNGKGEFAISPFLTYDNMLSENRVDLTTPDVSERNAQFVELSLTLDWFASQAVQRRHRSDTNPPPQPATPPLVARLQASAAQILEDRKRPRKRAPPTLADED